MISSPMYLAEVYWGLEAPILDERFHFAYDKRFLDCLHRPTPVTAPARLLAASDPIRRARLARFLENHDEPRSAAVLGEQLPAALCVMATIARNAIFLRRTA